jgi:hypothetical protein
MYFRHRQMVYQGSRQSSRFCFHIFQEINLLNKLYNF